MYCFTCGEYLYHRVVTPQIATKDLKKDMKDLQPEMYVDFIKAKQPDICENCRQNLHQSANFKRQMLKSQNIINSTWFGCDHHKINLEIIFGNSDVSEQTAGCSKTNQNEICSESELNDQWSETELNDGCAEVELSERSFKIDIDECDLKDELLSEESVPPFDENNEIAANTSNASSADALDGMDLQDIFCKNDPAIVERMQFYDGQDERERQKEPKATELEVIIYDILKTEECEWEETSNVVMETNETQPLDHPSSTPAHSMASEETSFNTITAPARAGTKRKRKLYSVPNKEQRWNICGWCSEILLNIAMVEEHVKAHMLGDS